jgi:hypothetical protein
MNEDLHAALAQFSTDLTELEEMHEYWIAKYENEWGLVSSPIAPTVIRVFDHFPTEEEVDAAMATYHRGGQGD